MTYTTFLSCFISLLVNSQMTSRKERLGGGVLMSWCSSTWTLNTIPSLKHKKRWSNCMYHYLPVIIHQTLSFHFEWEDWSLYLSPSLSLTYLCMAATASRFLTWSNPKDRANRRDNSYQNNQQPITHAKGRYPNISELLIKYNYLFTI